MSLLPPQSNCVGWALHVQSQSIVIPTSAHTLNPRDYKSHSLGKCFSWLRLVFMVFYDWIQLFGAAQCSERRSQFGRLAYWPMVPAINMFYFNSSECLLKNLDSECLCPQAPVTIIQYSTLLLHLLPLSLLHLFSPAKNDFLTSRAKSNPLPSLGKCNGICSPSSSRAAKSSNQKRHPSLSCGVE